MRLMCFNVTLFLTVTLWILHCPVEAEKKLPSRIAIIGGGIGGTSASYFMKEKFGGNVKIDIFEKDSRLCGRLATVNIGGREYESGGSIVHGKNQYMKTFVETLPGLEKADRYGGTLGIFDGTDYIIRTSSWSFITILKMFWTYGLSLFRINRLEDKFLSNFGRIYDLQKKGISYGNVSSLLHAMDDEFVHSTQITASDLFSSRGVNEFTIQNLISPAMRVNYGQDEGVNGFVGAVAMAGIQPGLWSVKGGNKVVCDKLIENSGAEIIWEKVRKIGRNEARQFTVFTSERNESSRDYDIVIITTPLGGNMFHINLEESCVSNCPPQGNDEDYRRTVANFVRGKLNPALFKCSSIESCPTAILITNDTLFYRSVGLHVPVDYKPGEPSSVGVYKVFSTNPLTTEQRDLLFESHSETATVDWKAYPLYKPPDTLGSFVLNENGMYYTSPIEWAASAIEMSVISAKNAALLAYNNWFGMTVQHSNFDEKEL